MLDFKLIFAKPKRIDDYVLERILKFAVDQLHAKLAQFDKDYNDVPPGLDAWWESDGQHHSADIRHFLGRKNWKLYNWPSNLDSSLLKILFHSNVISDDRKCYPTFEQNNKQVTIGVPQTQQVFSLPFSFNTKY